LKVLVAGASGMVGRAVSEYCRSRGDTVFPHDHQSLDITDAPLVMRALERERPEAVINCAAWTDVDGCEFDPARAQAVNASGPENLAKASRRVGAVLVTISTDYVFAGDKDGFYTQRDDPNPQSVYGVAKFAGEQRAQPASARTIVVRSGFIFGPGGRNFLSTVVGRVRRGEKVSAISDAWGTPTYSLHLASRLRELAQLDLPGIYHVVNSGDGASYEEFVRALAEELGGNLSLVTGVTADSLKRPAPRPRNARLKCVLSEAIGLSALPSWRHALRDFLALNKSDEGEN
jgi:dTDP-4-dehydrorhamnose reductase